MSRLPRVTGGEVLSALGRAGFVVIRVVGSHHHLRRPDGSGRVVVPVHAGKTLKPKTLATLLHQAGLTVEEFRRLI